MQIQRARYYNITILLKGILDTPFVPALSNLDSMPNAVYAPNAGRVPPFLDGEEKCTFRTMKCLSNLHSVHCACLIQYATHGFGLFRPRLSSARIT